MEKILLPRKATNGRKTKKVCSLLENSKMRESHREMRWGWGKSQLIAAEMKESCSGGSLKFFMRTAKLD